MKGNKYFLSNICFPAGTKLQSGWDWLSVDVSQIFFEQQTTTNHGSMKKGRERKRSKEILSYFFSFKDTGSTKRRKNSMFVTEEPPMMNSLNLIWDKGLNQISTSKEVEQINNNLCLPKWVSFQTRIGFLSFCLPKRAKILPENHRGWKQWSRAQSTRLSSRKCTHHVSIRSKLPYILEP